MTTLAHPLRLALTPRTAHLSRSLTNTLFITVGVGFMSAMAQVAIQPAGWPVPITGQTLGMLLISTSYGYALGVSTLGAYLLIGALGAPIFSQGNSGFAALFGPTGGYLFGMLLASCAVGYLAERKWDSKVPTALLQMLIGEVLIFIPGVLMLAASYHMGLGDAFYNGCVKFLGVEGIKIALAGTLLPGIWAVLARLRAK
ncbi:MAG: biotin transporter BioY [Actinobacteria bacterium]|jgi:biotin transport system substrate-specific component|nr:biotin transporter BioY [Actinomycetota bacterium]NBP90895.1 biotin transporter BioY [Actinomycetota bacterium]